MPRKIPDTPHPMPQPGMRWATYGRVSSRAGANGLLTQRDTCDQWVVVNEGESVGWYHDLGIPGTLEAFDKRLGWFEAIDAIKTGKADGIVVARLDRLARDLTLQERILADVWRIGGVLAVADPEQQRLVSGDVEDPTRRLIRHVLGAVSDFERAAVAARIRGGVARSIAEGGGPGRRFRGAIRDADGKWAQSPDADGERMAVALRLAMMIDPRLPSADRERLAGMAAMPLFPGTSHILLAQSIRRHLQRTPLRIRPADYPDIDPLMLIEAARSMTDNSVECSQSRLGFMFSLVWLPDSEPQFRLVIQPKFEVPLSVALTLRDAGVSRRLVGEYLWASGFGGFDRPPADRYVESILRRARQAGVKPGPMTDLGKAMYALAKSRHRRRRV